ncbi:hypothetical protein, partial [Acinetobacter nosocomialis]|uniref:hypothetical protein n=1 Tax=Acinetobacter nosocomialis TaxID=106654 RepID=UPI001C06A0E1
MKLDMAHRTVEADIFAYIGFFLLFRFCCSNHEHHFLIFFDIFRDLIANFWLFSAADKDGM